MRAPKKKLLGSEPTVQPVRQPAPGLEIHLAPSAEARLHDAGQALPTAGGAAESALPGWQSLGKGHKPTQSTGRQGPRERKVRW
ncbi:hypothetical protein LJ756_15410 [Arthrobacter sp. zg-Y411]|uniref:hypothetical protein n=1 Tax=Arthrobacter TaxID=1663 RepID=UPI001D135DB2|nr:MULTISPECIES: hypothetical protein [Arthrobacter]MCC3296009.1 hypothetical protein [Arthrobacter zhangbolii]MDN3905739.1 hypothetical protein [Arthrobacter sp. YD2]